MWSSCGQGGDLRRGERNRAVSQLSAAMEKSPLVARCRSPLVAS
jgi:hypothetical protein